MKKMILTLIALLSLTLSGCRESIKQPDIIATLFPQYAITRTLIGDRNLHLTLIIPAGSDGHHFTPSSRDIMQINNAKLFLYTSDAMEPWVKNITANKIDLSHGLEDHAHEHGHDHDHVHYFVSIENQIHMTELILEGLIHIDPDNKAYYQANANKLISDLTDVLNQFKALGEGMIHYLGHNVFDTFTDETQIEVYSLLSSFTDEANPTSQDLKAMIDSIKTNNIKVLYYDLLTMKDLALQIKKDLENDDYTITLYPLHSFHNVLQSDFNTIKSLADFWLENYEVIKKAYA